MIHPFPARYFLIKSVSQTGSWSTEALCAKHRGGKSHKGTSEGLPQFREEMCAWRKHKWTVEHFLPLFRDSFSHAAVGCIRKLVQC